MIAFISPPQRAAAKIARRILELVEFYIGLAAGKLEWDLSTLRMNSLHFMNK
jgi:hypothetical protein